MIRRPPRSTLFPLHDALPIYESRDYHFAVSVNAGNVGDEMLAARVSLLVNGQVAGQALVDRKSTRLNSSHSQISYAVFCLKKKKHINIITASHTIAHSIVSCT